MSDYEIYLRACSMFNKQSSIPVTPMTRAEYAEAASKATIFERDQFESRFDALNHTLDVLA
jgi:hypothetical protein